MRCLVYKILNKTSVYFWSRHLYVHFQTIQTKLSRKGPNKISSKIRATDWKVDHHLFPFQFFILPSSLTLNVVFRSWLYVHLAVRASFGDIASRRRAFPLTKWGAAGGARRTSVFQAWYTSGRCLICKGKYMYGKPSSPQGLFTDAPIRRRRGGKSSPPRHIIQVHV